MNLCWLGVLASLLTPGEAQDGAQRIPISAPESAVVPVLPAGSLLRVHDAAGLVGHDGLDALVAEIERGGGSPNDALERLERLAPRRALVDSTTESLLAFARDWMTPPLAAGQRIERLAGGRLVLLGTGDQQAWLADFLASTTAFRGLIDVQTQVYRVPAADLPEDLRERHGRVWTAGEANALRAALAGRGIDPVTAPRVLTHPFQEGQLMIGTQQPYVKEYEVKVLPERGLEVADPVVEVLEEGVQLRVRSVPLAAGRFAVYAELTHTTIEALRDVEQIVGGRPVTIQLPELVRIHAEGRFELGQGEVLLLCATADRAGEELVVALLEARGVPEEGR